jgi:sugar-specific transcriptional regulator TrmB
MEILNELQSLGFAEYEARVYLALLAHQPATGYQLGVRAAVPRSMVYEALGRLESRGAVLKSGDGRTTLYRPVPPSVFLDRLEHDYRNRLTGLRADLQPRYRSAGDDRFWTASGIEPILGMVEPFLEAAARSLMLMIADDELARFGPALLAADQRGVTIGAVLTGERSAPCGLAVRHPRRESQIQQLDRLLLVCRDGEEVLIGDLRGTGSATLTTNSHMVHIASQFVWMELLTQHLMASAPDPMSMLSPSDRATLEVLGSPAASPGR